MRKDSNDNNHYVQLLNRACKNAITLAKYEKLLAVQERSIIEIQGNASKFEVCPDAMSKAETRRHELQNRIDDIKESISDLQAVFVQEWMNALTQASNTETQLSYIQLPTKDEDVAHLADPEKYNSVIKKFEEEAHQMTKDKLDASELPTLMEEAKQTKESLDTMLKELQSKAEQQLEEQKNTIEKWNQMVAEQSKLFNETYLVQNITNELMGIPCLKEEDKEREVDKSLVQGVTQRALNHMIGQQFIHQFNTDKHDLTIYPPNDPLDQTLRKLTQAHKAKIAKQEYNQKRLKAGLSKLSKMEKESDDLLSLFDKNMNADPVKRLQHNLEHIHEIMSNHSELITFLNHPDEKVQVISNDKEDKPPIPELINLYEEDRTLSNALATSLAHYTEECLFSDIRQRLDVLESRIS
ncbi:hypothetical protein EDC96DRAFT_509274 [Choanephora cucurbitarum]|nr:hypothetical protein EDC96DRAFT_509274 [Choanephora cucurbitarum]